MTKSILIAASDPNILYLLQRYAEESGFVTVRTGRSKEVPSLARRTNPCLIMLEVSPTRETGRAILRQLRAHPATVAIPVVAYSHTAEDAGDCSEGYSALLCESLLYDDFLSALEQVGVHA